MSEYTPDDEDVEVYFALGLCEYKVGNGGVSITKAHDAYHAWLAAHDRALREQIAQKIEVEMRRHDNAQIGFSAVGDAYAHAARIARREDQTDE